MSIVRRALLAVLLLLCAISAHAQNISGGGGSAPNPLTPLNWLNVTQSPCNAKGDGTTNDTAAFNTCLSAASALNSATVYVPTGKSYLLDPLTLPAHVCLSGSISGAAESTISPPVAPMLLVNSNTAAFITTGFGSCVKDLTLYWPTQVAYSASTPTSFNPGILVPTASNGGANISGVQMINAYAGINVLAGRTNIHDIKIGAYSYALNYDNATDFSILSNVVIEPFYDTYAGQPPDQNIDAWVRTNGSSIILRRVDEILMSNIGVYSAGTCINMLDSAVGASPSAGYGIGVNINCDQVVHGLSVKSSQSIAHGYKFKNFDVSGNGTGVGPSGVDALATVTGGTLVPEITWEGGAAWGTFSATRDMTFGAANGKVYVSNVRGINPVGLITAPTFPGNGVNFTNPYGVECRVFVTGGTITAIAINGTATGITSGMIILQPGDIFTAAYTGTPGWTWFGD